MRGARRALVERKRLDVLPSPPRKRDDERLEKKKNSLRPPPRPQNDDEKKKHTAFRKNARRVFECPRNDAEMPSPTPTLQPRTGSPLRVQTCAARFRNGKTKTTHTHGPTDPVLGANPSSEGTDPFCRLPLPTLALSTRGCTPWRPAADGGYGPTRELRIVTDPNFPGPPRAHRTPPETRRSTGTISVSPDEPIPRTRSFTKKRELFPGLPATSSGSLALPLLRPPAGTDTRERATRRRTSTLRVRVREY
ncbi:hypothetical protein Ahia01_001421000 [Argonauta hians]